MMYRIILVLVFLNGVLSQIQFQGPCDVKPEQVVSNVDIYRMAGLWYQRERIPNSAEIGDCSTHLYSILTPTLGFVFHSEQVNGEARFWYGIISKDNEHPEKFVATYGEQDFDSYVLATNYDDYALLYSCVNGANNTRNVFAWTLTRTVDYYPSDQVLQDLLEVLNRNPDIQNVSNWKIVDHDNCSSLEPQ